MRSLLWLLLLLTAGCHPAHWDREEMSLPGNLPSLEQVKIWSGDTVFRWHAVRYTRDSITGIPYKMPTTCDSCRIALPRYAVDSIHVGYRQSLSEDHQNIALLLLVGGAIGVVLAMLHIGK